MQKYLIDTNCFIYLFNNKSEEFSEWYSSLNDEQIVISNLVIYEIAYGIMNRNSKKNLLKIKLLIDTYETIDFTLNDALLSAKNRHLMLKDGINLSSFDLHIASQALNNDLIVATYNVKDFVDIPNLKLKPFYFDH
jgi:tRNA(fMet)-specific endonuclease VapC